MGTEYVGAGYGIWCGNNVKTKNPEYVPCSDKKGSLNACIYVIIKAVALFRRYTKCPEVLKMFELTDETDILL